MKGPLATGASRAEAGASRSMPVFWQRVATMDDPAPEPSLRQSLADGESLQPVRQVAASVGVAISGDTLTKWLSRGLPAVRHRHWLTTRGALVAWLATQAGEGGAA